MLHNYAVSVFNSYESQIHIETPDAFAVVISSFDGSVLPRSGKVQEYDEGALHYGKN